MEAVPPDALKCCECGAVLTPQDWHAEGTSLRESAMPSGPMCYLCGLLYCRDHLSVRKGAVTCRSCANEYERILTTGPVTDEEEARIIGLLLRDVSNTVGDGHQAVIARIAASGRLRAKDLDDYHSEVVDKVQQYMHDSFADTTWPRCPLHPNHPLWFAAGWWWCGQQQVERLGNLAYRSL